MVNRSLYESPLNTRYSSEQMSQIFSDDKKFITWRKLWVVLAKAQKQLGLNITQEQIDELILHMENVNYEVAIEREKSVRHDVMSHVYAYGEQCSLAKGIIHLGATSCYVCDNTDLIIMKEALDLIKKKLLKVIYNLKEFSLDYKNVPTLAFTHYQAAQLTTVGKRACLWMNDLVLDLENLNFVISNIKLRGVKGTTGTQASFMNLFNGDENKVKLLDKLVSNELGFEESYLITGQTYSRKVDSIILNTLSEIAQSASKFSNDIRLLQNLKEVEEPFEKNQIGSSAMAYKRNPMRSERLASLARHVMVTSLNATITASNQWFERTLDDSANKRISIPESFLALDGVLNLYINITDGLVVNEKIIQKHINEELPFMATENIMMEAVKKGANRQEIHERIRIHSLAAASNVKSKGLENDLLDRIIEDESFNLSKNEILNLVSPMKFTGRASGQVTEFIENVISPLLSDNIKDSDEINIAITV
ncbi:MAG: adenylosuccinate lyase [Sarcina sp.]